MSPIIWPVGWAARGQWGEDVARIAQLAGGVANDVRSLRVNGHLAVGRLGARSEADLAWETELLQHLEREGLTVPVPIPTTDGRLFADGLVVMSYVEGGPPETEADWRRVADMLGQLHRLRQGWPQQRPGWRSSTDLLHAETRTKTVRARVSRGTPSCFHVPFQRRSPENERGRIGANCAASQIAHGLGAPPELDLTGGSS